MKKYVWILGVLWMFCLSGCAWYSSMDQYDKGNHHGVAGSGEMARIKQDKLAIEKLKAQPVQTAYMNQGGDSDFEIIELSDNQHNVSAGYRGKVVNFDGWRKINFVIKGPETKGFLLAPGQTVEYSLIPGKYQATSEYRGSIIDGPKTFTVGVQTHNFMGEELHWYVYYNNR